MSLLCRRSVCSSLSRLHFIPALNQSSRAVQPIPVPDLHSNRRGFSSTPAQPSRASVLSSYSRPLPCEYYSDPAIFAHERAQIFGSNWLFYCRLSELSTPGSYVSRTIVGYPVVVYHHEKAKELVGFHNVCSHRGGPLVPHSQDNAASKSSNLADSCDHSSAAKASPLLPLPHVFQCRYHGWLYDSHSGLLKAAPSFGSELSDQQKRCLSLKKIDIQVWQNQMVFVKLNVNQWNQHGPGAVVINPETASSSSYSSSLSQSPDPRDFPLLSKLKSLDPRVEAFHLEDYEFYGHHTEVLNCNWKTYVENYQEAYHVQRVHPSLHATLDVKQYRIENAEDLYSIHSCPAREVASKQGQRIGEEEQFLWLFLYPNLALNLYENAWSIEEIVPIGHDKTQLNFSLFTRVRTGSGKPRPAGMSESDYAERNRSMARDTLKRSSEIIAEDRDICEAVQKNLNSGVYQSGVLSPAVENGVALVQRNIRRDLKGIIKENPIV